jgi:hypothetical protein
MERTFFLRDDGTLKMWDAATGAELATLTGNEPRRQLRSFALLVTGRASSARQMNREPRCGALLTESVALVDVNDYIYMRHLA